MKFSEYQTTAKEFSIGGGEFWKPEAGENRIRVLTEYAVYGQHWIQADNRSYVCVGEEKGCRYCKAEIQPAPVFLMWIVTRNDNTLKIAQVTYSIIKQLGELAESEDWGFKALPEYDMVISKAGEKKKTRYTITPCRESEDLTEEEVAKTKSGLGELGDLITKMKKKVLEEMEQPKEIEPQFGEGPEQEEIQKEEIPE